MFCARFSKVFLIKYVQFLLDYIYLLIKNDLLNKLKYFTKDWLKLILY